MFPELLLAVHMHILCLWLVQSCMSFEPIYVVLYHDACTVSYVTIVGLRNQRACTAAQVTPIT